MAKLTRLATTVTARYYPSTELTDAFYMDGRLSGKRETRSADITTDKEDRGFFYSLFSHATIPGGDPDILPPYEPALRKLFNELKSGRKTLDDEIGELVNTAVSVTGRLKIQAENARSPFFAGVMVKDSEAFAITLGKGLAFLYRDDTLFPMTATDIKIDPINTQKQKVDHFYNYCATKTATALCSNIAQLKIDDCIILCNRELYDALGQQELLRILYDAEDQCEAAGNAITEAAAKVPNVPLQFMISFVENVSSSEKGGFFGFGKKKNSQQDDFSEEIQEDIQVAPTVVIPPLPVASAVEILPVGETLFFGNEPSDPFVQPLAEKPVSPVGPETAIQIHDETMKPFGEPVVQTETETDEGGFVKTVQSTEEIVEKKEEPSIVVKDEMHEAETVTGNVSETFMDLAKAPDSVVALEKTVISSAVPEKTPESFVMPDNQPVILQNLESAAPQIIEEPVTAAESGEETESGMSYFDFDGKDTPQYVPDDENDQSAPLMFGDQVPEVIEEEPPAYNQDAEYYDYSPQQYSQVNDVYSAPASAGTQNDGYYIPFESSDAPEPILSSGRDIPEMPIYNAPNYNPVSYSEDFGASSFEDAGVYARGSYTMDGEDSDVRRDYPPMPPAASNSAYSYNTPPRSAPPSAPRSSNPPPKPPRGPSYGGPPSGKRPHSNDPFDQERGFDYGHTDAAFNRNNKIMLGLGGFCVILLIAIIMLATGKCSNDKPKATTVPGSSSTPSSQSSSDTSATTPSGSETTPLEPTIPGTDPIGVFVFSDFTGYRTWWDLFNQFYNIQITSDTDSRITTIKTYNNLAADYVPKAGDEILLPPSSMIPKD
jgi:hypothetical protein